MTNSRFIHEYLDGGLGETERDSLFSLLSSDRGLQREFDSQMRLHLIAQSDMSAISPPIDVTNTIFSQLGFSIPTTGSNVASGNFIVRFWSANSRALISAIATFLLTSLAFFGFRAYTETQSNIASKSDYTGQFHSSSLPLVSSVLNNDGYLSTKSNNEYEKQNTLSEKHGSSGIRQNKQRSVTNNFTTVNNNEDNSSNQPAVLGAGTDYDENNANSTTEDENTFLNNVTIATFDYDGPGSINKQMLENSGLTGNNYFSNNVNNSWKNQKNTAFLNSSSLLDNWSINKDYSFTLNYLNNNATPNFNIPTSNSKFQNLSATLLYKIDNNSSIGLSCGRECFTQEFALNNNSSPSIIRQNPLLTWYGISYRYLRHDLYEVTWLNPFINAFVGGAGVGPFIKSDIGINFRISNYFALSFGYSGSALIYNVQGKIYKTFKYGPMYGINFSL